jgi:hypothetical protein
MAPFSKHKRTYAQRGKIIWRRLMAHDKTSTDSPQLEKINAVSLQRSGDQGVSYRWKTGPFIFGKYKKNGLSAIA